MKFKYKNVLIWGYGVSGRAVEKVLIDLDVDYTILDEFEKIKGGGFIDKLSKKDIVKYDLIVLSPGVNINRKEIVFAKLNGVDVISEIEFGYMFLNPKTKVIAVTGTNGKTTTVNLIYNLLKSKGESVVELGNIGKPFSEIYGKNYKYAVVELSSFQLEMCKNFKADIAVILNIAPDHIDRHKTFDNYKKAKLKIFNNQQKNDYAIYLIDDENLKDIKGVNAKTVPYSLSNKLDKYYVLKNKLIINKQRLIDMSNLNIPTIFYSDIMAMSVVADILNIDCESVYNLISKYNFLSHRCEYVAEICGIKYFNDSKATNIHAVTKCIDSIDEDNVLILMGGKNKDLDFKDFIINLDGKIKRIVAFGECGKKIYKLKKYNRKISFHYAKNLHIALFNIESYLNGIDCVILSPGCASFDEFNGYEARGDFFKKCINEMKVIYNETRIS